VLPEVPVSSEEDVSDSSSLVKSEQSKKSGSIISKDKKEERKEEHLPDINAKRPTPFEDSEEKKSSNESNKPLK
jgi:hypothetical protein